MRVLVAIILMLPSLAFGQSYNRLLPFFQSYAKATVLNGSTQYWYVPHSTSLAFGSSSFSFVSVIKYTVTPSVNYRIMNKFSSGGTGVYFIVNSSNYLEMRYAVSASPSTATQSSGAALNNGRPHVIVGSVTRGDSIRVYVDGARVAIAQANVAGSITTTDTLTIGTALDLPGTRLFNGIIGPTQIISGALSASQAAAAYTSWEATGRLPNVYGSFSTLFNVSWAGGGIDRSGNGNHLTPVASPPIITLSR